MSKFKVWKGDTGNIYEDRWYWHLRSRNGRIICSGQSVGYASKAGAQKGIEAVRRAVLL